MDEFPFTLIGMKTADELVEGEWIISHAQFVRVVNVTESAINTTGKLRKRYGRDYLYNVYTKDS